MSYMTMDIPLKVGNTSSQDVAFGPIDIKDFDRFSILFRNDNTAITFLTLTPEISVVNGPNSASEQGSDWVVANSAIIPVPSALGATASVMTSAIENTYRWLRFTTNTCQTMTAGSARIIIGGHRRLS